MAQSGTVEYLVVVSHKDVPQQTAIIQAFAGAGLGVFEYVPESATPPASSRGRTRLGIVTSVAPSTPVPVRILVYRHDAPVTQSMTETTFTRLTRELDSAAVDVMRSGTVAMTVRVTLPEDDLVPALDWSFALLRAILQATGGVAIDPIAQRCYTTADLVAFTEGDLFTHIAIHFEPDQVDTRWIHTHGLQKFHCPELELLGVPTPLEPEAVALLRDIARHLARGERIAAGDDIDMGQPRRLSTATRPLDADHAAAFGRLCIIDRPLPAEREHLSITRYLKEATLLSAEHAFAERDYVTATDAIERVLTVDPDDAVALTLRARILLVDGDPIDALGVGELLTLRVAGDYRGPYVCGLALTALGRYPEALTQFDLAASLDPEAPETFAARAVALERVGYLERAAEDRARASYLRQ